MAIYDSFPSLQRFPPPVRFSEPAAEGENIEAVLTALVAQAEESEAKFPVPVIRGSRKPTLMTTMIPESRRPPKQSDGLYCIVTPRTKKAKP